MSGTVEYGSCLNGMAKACVHMSFSCLVLCAEAFAEMQLGTCTEELLKAF